MVACMVIGFIQVKRGLASFNELRTQSHRRPRRTRRAPRRRVSVRSSAARQRFECAIERSGGAGDARADQGRRSRARAEDAADAPQPAGGAGESRRTGRAGGRDHATSRSDAPPGRLPPGACACLRVRRQSDGAVPRAHVGRRAGADDDDDPRRSASRDRCARITRTLRAQPARGFRGDARQSRGQRVQVGQVARRGAFDHRRRKRDHHRGR